MIVIQLGIVIFLLIILAIVCHDEYKRKILSRKSARLNRFWDGKDRRNHTRINSEINVLYELVSGRSLPKRNSISRNISVGGINLTLTEKLFPGTVLKLELALPEKPRPIFTQGEVVWAKEISASLVKKGEQRCFATGIRFIQIKLEDQTLLGDFVNQTIKDAPEQIAPYT